MLTARGGGMLGQVGRCCREGLSLHTAHLGPRPPVPLSPLLAAPDRPPCRRSGPGPARPGSARPRRPRRSTRSACAAAAAAPPPLARPPRSARPRDPLPPAVPRRLGRLQRWPTRGHTPSHSTRGARGSVTHSHAPSRGHTLRHRHTHTGSHTASQTLPTATHSHSITPPRGHAESNTRTQTQSHAHMRSHTGTVPDSITRSDTLE